MFSRAAITRIVTFITSLLFCFVFPVGQASGDGAIFGVSYKTYDTTYEAILNMYLKVIPVQCREQSWGRHDLYNELMYYDLSPYYMEGIMTPEYDRMDDNGKAAKRKELQEKTLQYMKSTIGYAIQDINGDGIQELIIGRDKSYIYELFTMEDGKVRELIRSGARYTCNLLKNGGLFRYDRDGGAMYGYILFHMNGTGRVEFDKGYYYNGDLGYYLSEDVDCWFRITNAKHFSANTMEDHVPGSEAKAWISECESSFANIHFIPLSAFEKGMSGDGIAILSVNGKTSGSQKVRIRTKPDKKSKILMQKKVGTYVKAIGTDGEYYQVIINKKTGYVHKDYLTIITDLPADPTAE